LVEIWQTNAAGRYMHKVDQHDAPLDPNFHGAGRTLTDENGVYRFTTIKPGSYPWRNHLNAWRPHHIHFSVFGTNFLQRLVTQMYFPAIALPFDPIHISVPDAEARKRLISTYDHDVKPNGRWATVSISWSAALARRRSSNRFVKRKSG
jgi:protocatechuate 3,4-dioxygenase beta subunit